MRKIVVLACVLALIASAAIIAGCGGGSGGTTGGTKTPEQVAKAFFAAIEKIDTTTTTWDLMSAESQKAIGTKTDLVNSAKGAKSDTKYTVGKVTVNGNKATAKVTATQSGKTSTQTVQLVKENGLWKVDLTAALK